MSVTMGIVRAGSIGQNKIVKRPPAKGGLWQVLRLLLQTINSERAELRVSFANLATKLVGSGHKLTSGEHHSLDHGHTIAQVMTAPIKRAQLLDTLPLIGPIQRKL